MTEEKEDKTNDLKEVRAKRFHPSKFCGSLFQLCVVSYGSRLHSRPWTGFGMRIYKKSVSFVRPNPKFGVQLAIIWEMSIFNEDCGPSLSLTLNVEP
jgi:hypothetical protein